MLRLIFVFGLVAGIASAQEAGVAEVLARLPEAQVKRLKADPDRFAEVALAAVYGYGTGGALTRAQAEAADAVEAAARRARALVGFLQSDLDNDGSVARSEMEARGATLSAAARARLVQGFVAADADADGAVTAAEMRGVAEAAAAPKAGRGAVALMGYDLDADGRLTVEEVEALRAALAAG